MAKFLPALQLVLQNEGGLVDSQEDPGGATNFGISLRFIKKKVKIDADEAYIRNLSIDDAERIYKQHFWDRLRIEEIDSQKIANRLFDLAVNCGPRTAVSFIQKSINTIEPSAHLVVDGILGIKTLTQINALNVDDLYHELICHAARFYKSISRSRQNKIFLKGWLNRLYGPC